MADQVDLEGGRGSITLFAGGVQQGHPFASAGELTMGLEITVGAEQGRVRLSRGEALALAARITAWWTRAQDAADAADFIRQRGR